MLCALTTGILYAALDEMHQSIVPGRSADFMDMVADSVGLISALGIFYFVRSNRKYEQKRGEL